MGLPGAVVDLYIDREPLLRGLARIQGIVEKKPSNQNYAHVLMEASGTDLVLTATDGTMTLIGVLQARVEGGGRCTADAAKLFAIVRLLDASVVRFQLTRGARLSVRAGNAEYHLNTTDGSDFPPSPARDDRSNLTVPGADLRRLVDETYFSVSMDDNRYGLNGAHLERVEAADGSSRLRMVTTDGSRLSLSEASLTGDLGIPKRTLIPRKALAELKKLVDEVDSSWTLSFGERSLTLSGQNVTLLSRLVDGDFPDYRQVLPTGAKRRVTIERDPLVACLKRVQLMAADRNNSVRFSFEEGRLLLSASDARAGDAREEVTVDLEGAPLATGFNVKYLLDILSNVRCERIQFDMGEALDPCLLRVPDRDDCLFVVMPMRLD
jgi:DNA polymerase-3 subunit beta